MHSMINLGRHALYYPRPERWPQVSLKGFFVLVTLLCVGLGWFGVQLKWMHDREAAFRKTTAYVGFEGNPAPWSIRLLGARGFREIYVVVHDAERLTEANRADRKQAE